MTFCLGMRLKDGIVGIADTRVTSGSETIVARKLSTFSIEGGSFFVMTSGLRSVRDKALTYFDVHMQERADRPYKRLYEVANAFAEQIRKVAAEDKASLEASGTRWSINVLLGGQLPEDAEHKLYQIYPEANWVEIGPGTPYHIIGASGYGKPVLDRTLKFDDTLEFGLKVGCLAFDSTRISAADVGFPIDVVVFHASKPNDMVVHRYEQSDFKLMSTFWQERLRESISNLNTGWIDSVFFNTKDTKNETDPPPSDST